MAKFAKGNPGGPGRPVGSKDKNYLSLGLWFGMLYEDAITLPTEKRLIYVVQAIDKLLSKVQALPGEPGDSVKNAMAAFNLLNTVQTPVEPSAPVDPAGTEGQAGQGSNGSNGAS